MIRTIFLIIIAACSVSFADGPRFSHKDKFVDQEFENVYHDIDHAVADPLTLSGLIVSTITVSSVTATNATITNLIASDISGVSLGKVLQAVAATTTSDFSTTNSVFQTTNLGASITPSNTANKVLVLVSGPLSNSTQNNTSYLSLSRGGNNIGGANGFVSMFTVTGGNTQTAASIAFLDSPNTTSAAGYAVTIRVGGGTGSFGTASETQSIVLIEIEG